MESRRRIPLEVAADLAEAYAAVPHGERTAFVDRTAAAHGVCRATLYRYMQPHRAGLRGRIQAQHGAVVRAAELAATATRAAERAEHAARQAKQAALDAARAARDAHGAAA